MESTPAGLYIMIVRVLSVAAPTGLPSTAISAVDGSNRAPGSRTTAPFTDTRPSSIIAAAPRLLATPRCESMF